MDAKIDTLDGETRTLSFRSPLQSALINRMAESAELQAELLDAQSALDAVVQDDAATPSAVSSARARTYHLTSKGHGVALDWLAEHSKDERIDRAWLDESVSFDRAISLAQELMLSRMPSESAVGKSEPTPD